MPLDFNNPYDNQFINSNKDNLNLDENSKIRIKPTNNPIITSSKGEKDFWLDPEPMGDFFAPFGGYKGVDKKLSYNDLNDIPEARAQKQSNLLGHALGQMATEFVFGLAEDAGYVADFEELTNAEKQANDGFDNWFSKGIREAKEYIQDEYLPIYRSEQSMSDSLLERMTDATWWASQGKTVGITLSLLVPGIGVARGVSLLGKGLRALKYGDELMQALQGISAAMFSRKAESAMEANQTFQQEYEKYRQEGLSDTKARELAGESAAGVFKANAAMLPVDMLQYSLLLKPFAGLKSAIEGAKSSGLGKVGNLITQMGSEAGEEAYQFIAQQENIKKVRESVSPFGEGFGDRLADYITDPDFQESAVLGGAMGGFFDAAGSTARKIADVYDKQGTKKYIAANLKDLDSFNKVHDGIEGQIIARAIKTGQTSRVRDEIAVLGQSVDAREDYDDAAKTDTKNRLNSLLENLNFVEEADKKLQTKSPGYANNPNTRKQFALLQYQNKKNNEYLRNAINNVNSARKAIDEKDNAVYLKQQIDAYTKVLDKIRNDESLNKNDSYKQFKKNKIQELEGQIKSYTEELNNLVENIKTTVPGFDINNYKSDPEDEFKIAVGQKAILEANKDILAMDIARFDALTDQEVNQEEQQINKKIEKNIVKVKEDQIGEVVNNAKTPEEIAKLANQVSDDPVIQKGIKKAINKEADKVTREYSANDFIVDQNNNGSLRINPDIYDPMSKEGMAAMVRDMAEIRNRIVSNHKFNPDVIEQKNFNETIDPMLRNANNMEEFNNTLNQLEYVGGDDFKKLVTQQITDVWADRIKGIKIKKKDSIYDSPEELPADSGDIVIEPSKDTREKYFIGNLMEYVINKKNKTTGKKVVDYQAKPYDIEDTDYNPEYKGNNKTMLQYEINLDSKQNKKAIAEKDWDNVQILGVEYDSEGKRHVVTMLGVPRADKGGKEITNKLADLRQEIINGAVKQGTGLYKSGISSKAEKTGGVFFSKQPKIPLNQLQALPEIDGKKKLILGITRYNKERGVYLDTPDINNTIRANISQIDSPIGATKPGAVSVWADGGNGKVYPVRVFTLNYERIQQKYPEMYAKDLQEIKNLLSEKDPEKLDKNLEIIDKEYFHTLMLPKEDKKGNISKVVFIKDYLKFALDELGKAKNKSSQEYNEVYDRILKEYGISAQELSGILAANKSVLHTPGANIGGTHDLSFVVEIGNTDPNSKESINSPYFERFIKDMQHQIDIDKINTGTYNEEVAEKLLEIDMPASRIMHSPIYEIEPVWTKAGEEVKKEKINNPVTNQKNPVVDSVEKTDETPYPTEGVIIPEPKSETENLLSETLTEDDINFINNGKPKRLGKGKAKKRLVTNEVKQNKVWNKTSEIRWLVKNLPVSDGKLKLEIVNSLINIDNQLAWGVFKDNMIQIYNGAPMGTVYHEAFHAVFNMALTDPEISDILSEARSKFGFKNNSDIEIEEYLAEKFSEYVQSMEYTGKSLPEKIAAFFRRLYQFFKNNLFSNSEIDKFFYNVNSGSYKHAEFFNYDGPAKKSFAGLNYVQEEARVNNITHALIEVIDDIASIPENSKLSRTDIIKSIGLGDLAEMAYNKLVDHYEANEANYGDNLHKDFRTMLRGFIDLAKDENGEEYIPENPSFRYLGRKALTKFALIEKVNINLDQRFIAGIDPVTDEEITEMNEEVNKIEHWMITITEQSLRDKVNSEIKSLLSKITRKDKKGNPVKDDLGFDTYLDYNQNFATLLRELEGLTTSEEMMEKFKEFTAFQPEFRDVYNKVIGNPLLKTKFWISMQNVHAPYMNMFETDYSADKKLKDPSKRRTSFSWYVANKQGGIQFTMEDWRNNINTFATSIVARKKAELLTGKEEKPMDSPAYKTWADNEIENLKGYIVGKGREYIPEKQQYRRYDLKTSFYESPELFVRYISQFGFDISVEELEKFQAVKTEQKIKIDRRFEDVTVNRSEYTDFVNAFSPVLQGIIRGSDPMTSDNKLAKEFKYIATKITAVRPELMESSFRSSDGKTRYSHILIGYAFKLASELRNKNNFDLSTGEIKTGSTLNKLAGYAGMNIPFITDLTSKDVEEGALKISILNTFIPKNGNADGIQYDKLTPTQLSVIRLNAFLKNKPKNKYVDYMLPVLSDSPQALFITAKRYDSTEVTDKTRQLLYTEWDLIKEANKVSSIKNFKDKAADFNMFVDFNEKVNPDLHKQVTDILKEIDIARTINSSKISDLEGKLNSHINNFLEKRYESQLQELIDQKVITKDENGILKSDQISAVAFIDPHTGINLREKESQGTLSVSNKKEAYISVEEFVKDYSYNYVIAKANMLQLFIGNPGVYKNTEDIYKRMKEIWSPGKRMDIKATFEITPEQMIAEDGISTTIGVEKQFKTITVKDHEKPSSEQFLQDILNIHLAKGKGWEAYGIAAKFGYSNYEKDGVKYAVPEGAKFEQVHFKTGLNNLTDGWTAISPWRMREVNIGLGKWNDEKQTQFIRLIQGKESSMVNNPFKSFTFGFRDKNGARVPYQLKNSEAMIDPSTAYFTKDKVIKLPTDQDRADKYQNYFSPLMAKMLDLMTIHGIGAINFDSTIKEGLDLSSMYKSVDEIESIDTKHIELYSNEDYMLMQEVPDHFTDSKANYGTQLRKLIIADLSDDAVFDVNGESLSKEELISRYEDIIEADVTISFDDVARDFPTENDDLETYNNKIKRLSARLIRQANDRGLGSDSIFALGIYMDKQTGKYRFNIPLFDPLQASKTEALLGAEFRNNVVKQKINGGNLVMVSSVGYSDDLQVMLSDDKKSIKYIEVYLPAWSEEKFKGLISENGWVDMDKITDKSILNVIGYRIPTEDKYSMLPLRVKGFLPRSAGGIIIAPKEITTLTGADFDIDKLYMMFPEFTSYRRYDYAKVAEELRLNGYNVTTGYVAGLYQRINNKESLDNRDLEIYDTIENFSESIKNKISETIINKIQYNPKLNPEEQSKAARDNGKIDIIWSILTNADVADKQLDPGNFDHLTNISKAIKKKKKYSANLDILSPVTDIKMFEAATGASALIGVFANQNVNNAVFQQGNVTLKEPVKFNKQEFSNLSKTTERENVNIAGLDEDTIKLLANEPKRTSRKLSMMLSAIVDDLKHLNSGPLNINFFTADIISVMMRLGFNMATSMALINQPIILDLTKKFNEYGGTFEAFDQAYDELSLDGAPIETDTLNFNTLWKNIGKNYINTDMEQQQALALFKQLKEITDAMKKPVQAFRSDNIKRKVNIASNYVFKRRVEKMLENNNILSGLQELWSNYKIGKVFYDKGVVESSELMNGLFLYDNSVFKQIRDKISDNLTGSKELSEDNINMINYQIMSGIINKFEFFDGNKQHQSGKKEIEYILNDFPGEYQKFISKHPNLKWQFRVLNHIYKENKDYRTPIDTLRFRSNSSLTDNDKMDIANSWMGLLTYTDPNNPELSKELNNIGENLIKYAYHAWGFQLTPHSFSQYVPMEWRSNLKDSKTGKTYNDYLYDLFNVSKESRIFTNLYRQFKQHNAINRFFVARVELNEDTKDKMIEQGYLRIKDNIPQSITLTPKYNKLQILEKKIDNSGNTLAIFPDYISYMVEDKVYLLQAVDQIEEPVFSQNYRVINTLGVKQFAMEYDMDVIDKKSIFDSNNVKETTITPELQVKASVVNNQNNKSRAEQMADAIAEQQNYKLKPEHQEQKNICYGKGSGDTKIGEI